MTVAVSGESITFNDNSVQATAPKVGMVNRIINGAMVIDQRNAGASVTINSNQYTIDRYQAIQTQTGKYSVQQSTTVPTGFKNSLLITSASAYSITSSDTFYFRQSIEGYNAADLAFGTASAATVTLSFSVRSSLTGTFGGALKNDAGNRSYPFSYTISAANTWEQKSITIAGDQSGTWDTGNARGLQVIFGLGVGSTYSTTAGAWAAGDYSSATGATSVVGTSGATFYITGVQLEKGSTATSFDYRPYGTELLLAQRYYFKLTSFVTAGVLGVGITSGATSSWVNIISPVAFRASPTVSYSALAISDQASYNCIVSSIAATAQTLTGGGVAFNHAGGATLYRTAIVNTTSTSGYIDFSAEL